jgi:uncharacterized membrane protein
MNKKRGSSKSSANHNGDHKNKSHPIFRKVTLGEKASDKLSQWAGSWVFIFIFLGILVVWMIINTYLIFFGVFDPYPFILLNLALSCLAAIQAPIILMTQNRQAERDRQFAKYDYSVNRLAEREIKLMQKDLDSIKYMLSRKLK